MDQKKAILKKIKTMKNRKFTTKDICKGKLKNTRPQYVWKILSTLRRLRLVAKIGKCQYKILDASLLNKYIMNPTVTSIGYEYNTATINPKFASISGWSVKDFNDCGFEVVSIKIRGQGTLTGESQYADCPPITLKLPRNKKYEVTLKSRHYVKFERTLQQNNFDDVRDAFIKQFTFFTFYIKSIRIKNEKGDLLHFRGIGTRNSKHSTAKMVLYKINGVRHDAIVFDKIVKLLMDLYWVSCEWNHNKVKKGFSCPGIEGGDKE